MLDLKYLLREAKQKVPPFLETIVDANELFRDADAIEQGGKMKGYNGVVDVECTFCSGLGHRITNCPKLEKERKAQSGVQKGMHAGGDFD